jgi:hypothetical protein
MDDVTTLDEAAQETFSFFKAIDWAQILMKPAKIWINKKKGGL